ncbi:MAG: hypothetical protein QM695_15945 [Micropruina sp.]
MSRTRASAKAAGTRLESLVAGHLAEHIDDRIERRAKTGAADRGDIGGVRTAHGHRLVVESKDYGGRIKAAEWTREAHIEAGNDDAIAGIVVAKRRGVIYAGDQWVLMTVDDLIAILTGTRPDSDQ